MANYFLLEGCPVEGMEEYLSSHLGTSMDDYPGGIVLPLDKPLRWTSADLVRKVKFTLQKQTGLRKLKVGHAGTLDPLATGMLIVCVGAATRIAESLQAHEKEYVAQVEFGASTASFDLEQPLDSFYPWEHISREAVEEALRGFIGPQEQVAPAFSAKIVGGVRSYEYARSGEPVPLRTATIEIYEAELLDFRCGGSESTLEEAPQVAAVVRHVHNYHTAVMGSEGIRPRATIRIRCSRGTYIRSLARDLGLALGSGAYLTSLRRTASGPFKI